MGGRLILFGATGYTGRLTAEALARRSTTNVVLAGRNAESLADLAEDLARDHQWECDTCVADAGDIRSVAALISSPHDALISTVGPFARFGRNALEAATAAGAAYVDCTGEAPFIRKVFEHYGPRAKRTGASLLTAFGYDYAPGNLAGLLAIREAQAAAYVPNRVDVGYFVQTTADVERSFSGGTAASAAAMIADPGYTFRDGQIVRQRPAAQVRSFVVAGSHLDALSLGASEQFTLPRLDPTILDVNVYLGWAGPRTRQAATLRGLVDPLSRVPLLPRAADLLAGRFVQGSTGGPGEADRAATRTLVVGEAFVGDRRVGRVVVEGPGPYDLTADLLAWAGDAARRGAWGHGSSRRSGALGPIEAFGEKAFVRGCATLGLAPRTRG